MSKWGQLLSMFVNYVCTNYVKINILVPPIKVQIQKDLSDTERSHGSVSRNGIKFEVDKPIKLLGVTILGDPSKNKILDFYIKVRDESSDKLIAHSHEKHFLDP